ncbi:MULTISPECIES: hypothetical protein [unclassified Pseudoalteromonas]|uniref:hypothetical protein n=1 Tax=unclassified Pseudoalteromonas TaxID=194690 RepID=UPI0005A89798|nr:MULTISPECIES: hypothetical protein [unclassified Pseudoalteromonas]
MSETTMENKQNYFIKLLSGGFRLVDVFWAGYFIVGTILALVVSKLQNEQSIIVGDCLNSIYLIIISVAVWNSSTQFIGKKYWAILAKVFAVLATLSSLMGLAVWVYHLMKD